MARAPARRSPVRGPAGTRRVHHRGLDNDVDPPRGGPASPLKRLWPTQAQVRQAAVGVIVTVSFFASLGSGIVTSTTPSCVLALMLLASTPAGSAIERLKDP